jgi:hypothetical protein
MVDALHEFHLSLIICKKKFETSIGCQNFAQCLNLVEYSLVACNNYTYGHGVYQGWSCLYQNINKLETKILVTKEYFCNILDLLRTRINYRCNEDDNQHIATKTVMFNGVHTRARTLTCICEVLILIWKHKLNTYGP